jgi:hypothetical protein
MSPRTSKAFDITRHLTQADLFYSPPGYVILVKWTKTHQHGQHVLLPVPEIPHKHCPIKAIRRMLADHTPTTIATRLIPLFMVPNTQSPMTTTYLAQSLRVILAALGVDANNYSLHSLRRGGATSAFNAGVNHVKIQRHGTWRSDCFWTYVTTSTLDAAVPQALGQAFLQSQP